MIIWRLQNCFSFNHTAFSERVVVTMTLKVNGGFLKMSPIMPNQSRYSRIFLSTSPKKVRKNLKLKISAKQWKLVQNEGEMKWNGLYMATTINRFFQKKNILIFQKCSKTCRKSVEKKPKLLISKEKLTLQKCRIYQSFKKNVSTTMHHQPLLQLKKLILFLRFFL